MKKLLKDLSRDELKALFDNNRSFQHKAYEYAIDNAYFWVDEYLRGISGADYEFGPDCPGYFRIRKPEPVFDWLDKAQADFCLLAESDYEKVKEARALHDRLYYSGDLTDEEDSHLFDELIPAIESAVHEYLQSQYTWYDDTEHVFEYAYEMTESIYQEDAYTYMDVDNWAIYEVVTHRYI